MEKKEQLNKIETRAVMLAQAEANRLVQETLADVVSAHSGFSSAAQLRAEDNKLFIFEPLAVKPADSMAVTAADAVPVV